MVTSGRYIIVMDRAGPMLRQHPTAEWIDLAKGDGLETARPLQAERKAADTGKKIQYGELVMSFC